MYVPEGVPGILVQPAWGSFPWNRATCKRTQEEEEGLFRANAVNEEDPERDRATQVWRRRRRRRSLFVFIGYCRGTQVGRLYTTDRVGSNKTKQYTYNPASGACQRGWAGRGPPAAPGLRKPLSDS